MTHRILIVEDHPSNRKLLRAQLEAEGHTVLEAPDGCEALEILEHATVDAVISDILMPSMDGFRLCMEIRRSETANADVPLVLYTATFDAPADRRLAVTVGADSYLVKPASTPVILAALEEAAENAKLRDRAARPTAESEDVLESYNSALVRKLEARNSELQHAVAELRETHEQILELNETLETRVEQRTAALNSANQELEAFACSIAHDLRTPLVSITGFAELLDERTEGKLDVEGREYVRSILGGALRMNRLIGALLEFARLGREALNLADVDLEGVLEEALEAIRPECDGRSIQWQRQRLPHARGAAALLRQVFINLIGNAVKYTSTRDPAIIEIGWRKGRAEELVVFIRDNGVGFDMAQANTLFGVFQRLEGAEPFEGTGIGLANAHRIITRHGGRIWAKATLGSGATFNFSLLQTKEVAGAGPGGAVRMDRR